MLVKDCGENTHRDFEIRLFSNPNGVSNNDNDWPIRFILSSYYHTYGPNGIPDGLSTCDICEVTCNSCKESVPFMPAYVPNECAYKGKGYTRVHRDIRIINAMRGKLYMCGVNYAFRIQQKCGFLGRIAITYLYSSDYDRNA